MKLIQIAHQSRVQMMGYVIVAPDGSISCIDGGNTCEADYMLAMCRKYGGRKPHIRYWFLTHAHSDHCDAFLALLPTRDVDFTLDRLVYTFPRAADIRAHSPGEPEPATFMEKIGLEHVAPAVGDSFDLGGAEMTVLQTFVPEEETNYINNSTTVFELKGEGVRTVFLGDLGAEAGLRLLGTYGAGLKCDVAQMAHHGQSGVTREVYEALNPDVCLWNAPSWLWSNTVDPLRPGKGPWTTLETRRWMKELGDRQRHVVIKDGTWELTLQDGRVEIDRVDRALGEIL